VLDRAIRHLDAALGRQALLDNDLSRALLQSAAAKALMMRARLGSGLEDVDRAVTLNRTARDGFQGADRPEARDDSSAAMAEGLELSAARGPAGARAARLAEARAAWIAPGGAGVRGHGRRNRGGVGRMLGSPPYVHVAPGVCFSRLGFRRGVPAELQRVRPDREVERVTPRSIHGRPAPPAQRRRA